MEKIKKIVAVVLMISLVLTSHSFYTFADSIEKNLESNVTKTKWEVEQDIYKSSEDVKDIESEDLDFTNLSDELMTASISDTIIFDDENENTNESFEEEPEEDPAVEELEEEMTTEESGVEASSASIEEETSIEVTTAEETTTSVGAISASPEETTTTVGASSASPEETTTSVGESSASPEETLATEETTTIEETSDSAWVSEDVEVGTSSEAMQIVEESIVESLLDDKATVSEIIDKVIDTKVNLSLATVSEMEIFGDGNDTFWFGTYPQNDTNGLQIEPIPWRLIRLMEDGTAIFTTYSILSKGPWHGVEDPDVSWKNCDLRNWLNNEFIIKAFSTKQIISDLMVNREDVNELDGETYNIGKVFLLDYATANLCFSSNEDRVAWPTAYAETLTDVGYNDWWLRNRFISVAVERGFTRFVYRTGDTEERIEGMNNASYCVRPAICLKMDSSLYRPGNVTWNLGDSSFKSESRLWNDFDNYFGGQKLPTALNMIEQPGKEFKGWKINDDNIIYSEIPVNQTGNITLTPVWQTLSLKYVDRYFGTDLTTYFENYNPALVNRPNGKFPYLADYTQGDILEDYHIEELLYRDGDGKFKPIPYNGEINAQNRTVYVVGSRGVLPPYFKTITDFELILDNVITKYKEGEALNVSGLIIKITLANGEAIRIAYSEELSQFFKFYPSIDQLLNSNVKEVSIEFGGLTAKYSIEVEKNRTSSGGGSGGSGGGGAIKSIQNTMFKDLPIMTTTIQTNKTINALVSMLSSNWIKNEISGKWMLSSKVEDGRTWMLSDGFYCVVRYENDEPVVDTYYFNDAGELVTGFVNTIDNNRYFFEVTQNGNEGKMVKGWRLIGNKWYYFGEDGAMYRYRMTPDGYFVDSNGEYIE